MTQNIKFKKVPVTTTMHGDERIDNYSWLQNRTDPDVLAQLTSENECTAQFMRPTQGLQDELYQEMVSRIQETDTSAPYPKGSHVYFTKTYTGLQYPVYKRQKASNPQSQEQTLIDLNDLGKDLKYISLGVFEVSPCENLLAYSVDTNGSEVYNLFIKDLTKGLNTSISIANVVSFVWAEDNETFFYTTRDLSLREYRVYRHHIKTSHPNGLNDALVYEEKDPVFSATVCKSKSNQFIFVLATSGTSKEWYFLPARKPLSALTLIEKRSPDHEYFVEHHNSSFFILTNQSQKGPLVNFRLVKTPCQNPAQSHWQEVIPHNPSVKLECFEAFKNDLVILERTHGLNQLVIFNPETSARWTVPQPEQTYSISFGKNKIYDTHILRYEYTSLTTPLTTIDLNKITREKSVVKVQPVLGGYEATNYVTERIFASAPDGTAVPISLVYHKAHRLNGAQPLYLTGYGSYGICYDVFFSSARLSLLNRGVIYAIAHIRGGGDLGEAWRNDGKMLKKQNTFTDFIACAEHLIKRGYTASDKLLIQGGSAGGLLMGAVLNLKPQLFKGAIADVPFVDCLNTMLDADLPLTTGEYVEWGNPLEKIYYEAIKAYCPYTNVKAQAYPSLLIKAGLNDPRVQYWEAAKWAAKLKELNTSSNPILLKTNMGAGHGGSSGRYDKFKEIAFDYAFVLKVLGINIS